MKETKIIETGAGLGDNEMFIEVPGKLTIKLSLDSVGEAVFVTSGDREILHIQTTKVTLRSSKKATSHDLAKARKAIVQELYFHLHKHFGILHDRTASRNQNGGTQNGGCFDFEIRCSPWLTISEKETS